jgi:tRNA pseudouridine38-40 synthase
VRFRLTVEYVGTRYSGWQVQPNARTVQGTLAHAVASALRTRAFEIHGAGRTDAGVHAAAQVAHLDTRAHVAPEPFRRRVNDELPPDIHVLRVEPAHARFHARHDAVARRYVYQICRRHSQRSARAAAARGTWVANSCRNRVRRRLAQHVQ